MGLDAAAAPAVLADVVGWRDSDDDFLVLPDDEEDECTALSCAPVEGTPTSAKMALGSSGNRCPPSSNSLMRGSIGCCDDDVGGDSPVCCAS